jgi:glycosyltransferase involved in cell wall biosynthesis
MKLVSYVLPTYNRQTYLSEAINSILGQTYKNIELIIIDDGSTDDSNIILDYFKKKDKRVKVFHQENKGISAARNNGIRRAKGDYIAVADSDDLSNPERIKTSVKAIKGHDFVYGVYGAATEHAIVTHWITPPEKVTLEDIRNNGAWPHLTLMAKKECFKGAYRDDWRYNDDAWLVWQWFKRGYKAKFINEPLAIQRGHSGNTSRVHKKYIDETQKVLDKEYSEYEG